jgi:hypothetical protein
VCAIVVRTGGSDEMSKVAVPPLAGSAALSFSPGNDTTPSATDASRNPRRVVWLKTVMRYLSLIEPAKNRQN